MRVALDFSMYMMRFGLARLAASYASASRPTDRRTISKRLRAVLTKQYDLSSDDIDRFGSYLKGKPGSPRYTPLRRRLERGDQMSVEQQDYWLSDSRLPSSVGALSERYLDDPFKLCQLLQMTKPGSNVLLSRGKLCRYDPAVDRTNPFDLSTEQRLFLGLWLLDVDGDWIWALLHSLADREHGEQSLILSRNRVALLLSTFQRLVGSRVLRSRQSTYVTARHRLLELTKITERNMREGLNLGQPWSWFLIPRLELLVDAGLLAKRQRAQLTGYGLSPAGRILQSVASRSETGDPLFGAFFQAHACGPDQTELPPTWPEVVTALRDLSTDLSSTTGYLPLFETAVALCVERHMRSDLTHGWEVPEVITAILTAGGRNGQVVLGINRQGRPTSFKLRA